MPVPLPLVPGVSVQYLEKLQTTNTMPQVEFPVALKIFTLIDLCSKDKNEKKTIKEE